MTIDSANVGVTIYSYKTSRLRYSGITAEATVSFLDKVERRFMGSVSVSDESVCLSVRLFYTIFNMLIDHRPIVVLAEAFPILLLWRRTMPPHELLLLHYERSEICGLANECFLRMWLALLACEFLVTTFGSACSDDAYAIDAPYGREATGSTR